MADKTVTHFSRREFLGRDSLDAIEVSFEDEVEVNEETGAEDRYHRGAYVHIIGDGEMLCFRSSGSSPDLVDFRERMGVVVLLLGQLLKSIDRVLDEEGS